MFHGQDDTLPKINPSRGWLGWLKTRNDPESNALHTAGSSLTVKKTAGGGTKTPHRLQQRPSNSLSPD